MGIAQNNANPQETNPFNSGQFIVELPNLRLHAVYLANRLRRAMQINPRNYSEETAACRISRMMGSNKKTTRIQQKTDKLQRKHNAAHHKSYNL